VISTAESVAFVFDVVDSVANFVGFVVYDCVDEMRHPESIGETPINFGPSMANAAWSQVMEALMLIYQLLHSTV
jgi:hypothetical protein